MTPYILFFSLNFMFWILAVLGASITDHNHEVAAKASPTLVLVRAMGPILFQSGSG